MLEATGFGVRGAIVEAGLLVDLIDADEGGEWVTDRLFIGQVRTVDSRLNCAFVDIGLTEDALLNGKDARFAAGTPERQPIARLVREGETIVVQGVREAAEGKGSRVTTDIKLFGFHLLWRPYELEPEAGGPVRGRDRELLRARGEGLFGDRAVTLRKLANIVDDDVLKEELAALEQHWQAVRTEAARARRPGSLGVDHPLDRLLHKVVNPALREIQAVDPALLARCRQHLAGPLRPHGIEVVALPGTASAFEQSGVRADLELLTARTVALARGGRLIVEPTAACVAIDVDGDDRPPLEVDLDAARLLARLVRLRNLGGTIIVDFVDLPKKQEQQRLADALGKAFRDDPAPIQIHPMSPLGIVQISRGRRGRSWEQAMTRACAACEGSGRAPSLRAVAEELIGRLRRSGGREVRLAYDLHRWLEGEGRVAWAGVAKGLVARADPQLPPGAFVIDDSQQS